MTTNLFSAALDKFRGRPRPMPVAVPQDVRMSSATGLQMAAAPVAVQAPIAHYSSMSKGGIAPPPFGLGSAVDVSPNPAPPVVESLGLIAHQNTMAPVKVALHHASEIPARFLSSLVGGR